MPFATQFSGPMDNKVYSSFVDMFSDSTDLLDVWDNIPYSDEDSTSPKIFDMLDEDIANLNNSQMNNNNTTDNMNLINKDIMWNSSTSLLSESPPNNQLADCSSYKSLDLSISDDFAQHFGRTVATLEDFFQLSEVDLVVEGEEFPSFDDVKLNITKEAQPDQFYDSCLSSPLSLDSGIYDQDSILDVDDACLTADLDDTLVDSLISDLNNANCSNQSLPRVYNVSNAVPSLSKKVSIRKPNRASMNSLHGQSLIMRDNGIQKAKAKTGPKPISILNGANNAVGSRNKSQLKLALKHRQAVRQNNVIGSTNISLLSAQDAMLKGASSLISPPISSDSEESMSSSEDIRTDIHKTLLKKKRVLPRIVESCDGAPTTALNRPLKRREHNDSERKRRDHLRTAFDELKQQVPKLANSERKPARIMILAEAANFAREITEREEKNRARLQAAMEERRRLQQLLERYDANGLC